MTHCPAQKQKSQPILPIPIVRPKPTISLTEELSAREELEIYKREYFRLAQENSLLLIHLAKATQEKEALESKYNSINIGQGSHEDRQKRVRRTASEISRQFDCEDRNCGKSYGTEASLVQHIKLKHPLYFTSQEYEKHITSLRKRTESSLPSSPHKKPLDQPLASQGQEKTRIPDIFEKEE